MTQPTHTVVTLPFPPAAIYDAFTQEALVTQWLTPEARVSLDRGLFELWGSSLPEAPAATATSLIDFERDRAIRFAWHVRGGSGQVAVTLTRAGEAQAPQEPGAGAEHCRVRITCALPPFEEGMADANDFWCLALENLRRLLSRQRGVVFPDFSQSPIGGAGVSIEIDAPATAVFDALVSPPQLDRYIATRATVDLRPGGTYNYGWKGGGPIKVLDVEPDRQLRFSWHYDHGAVQVSETVVTWTLEESNGRTRLTVVHSGFASTRKSDDYRTGWLRYLHAIKSMIELGEAYTRSELEGADY